MKHSKIKHSKRIKYLLKFSSKFRQKIADELSITEAELNRKLKKNQMTKFEISTLTGIGWELADKLHRKINKY